MEIFALSRARMPGLRLASDLIRKYTRRMKNVLLDFLVIFLSRTSVALTLQQYIMHKRGYFALFRIYVCNKFELYVNFKCTSLARVFERFHLIKYD